MNSWDDKRIVSVDSQNINMFQNCAYKYDLTFNKRLAPVEKDEAFERGDLIHRMLQVYYSMGKYRSRWPMDFNQDKMIKICERVGEHFAVAMSLQIEEVDATFRTFRDYVKYYWGEPIITHAVEQVGVKVLHEEDDLVILYTTKIDWIIGLKNVQMMPADHKTSKRRGPTMAISNQFMGYCWMLGVCNLMVNKVGFQVTLKPNEKFTRPIMSYPPPVLENWRLNTIWWVKEILRHEHMGIWPQNFTSCDKYSGCIYRQICEAPPEIRSMKARELFNIGESWDPGAKL